MPSGAVQVVHALLPRIAQVCVFTGALATSSLTFADAGAVRASQRHGNRQITVFTDPTPLRAGPIDVSVLVLDAVSGETIVGDTIDIEVAPRGLNFASESYRATNAAASNKLFQAANVDLLKAGWWEFTVEVRSPQATARVRFEAEAGEPPPRWQTLWAWFCWPFLIVVFFTAMSLWPNRHRELFTTSATRTFVR